MICNTDKQPVMVIPFNHVHDITLDTHLSGPSIYGPCDGPHEAEWNIHVSNYSIDGRNIVTYVPTSQISYSISSQPSLPEMEQLI